MTNKAIYIFRIAKIIVLVLVSITGMALCATRLVSRNRDTEVIDQVVLTNSLSFKSDNLVSFTCPGEMSSIEHFITFGFVAHQAGLRTFILTHAEEKIMNVTFS